MIEKSSIQRLIEQYLDVIQKLHEARNENRGIGFDNAMMTGKLGVYGRVVEDLKELLEVEDA